MNCGEFKELLIIRLCGRLTKVQKNFLEEHAVSCPACARLVDRVKSMPVNEPAGEVPRPDWEVSWHIIRDRSLKRKGRLPLFLTSRRFALIAAAVIVAFVLGIVAERSVFFPTTAPLPLKAEQPHESVASIAAYTETIEPLLIDFMNRGAQPTPGEITELTNRVIADMLSQTRLLKFAAARYGDGNLYQLLDDVELVLISISNLGGQNGNITAQLNHFIRNKSLLFRLRQLPRENEPI
ncbi:MAG: hypothetical protein JSV84_17000 [Gemmatimonadota bacterium]|nr:MAG: hypothetical protein JSV84_17000 [Gemmatimonadota bacterium]